MLADRNNSIANYDDYFIHLKTLIKNASEALHLLANDLIEINKKVMQMEDSESLKNMKEASDHILQVIIKNLKQL